MLGVLIFVIFAVIIVLFVLFAIVIAIFIINTVFLSVNIVKLRKGKLKRKIISIALPIIGIIASVLLSLPFFNLLSAVKYEQTKAQNGIIDFDKLKESAGTNTIILWEKEILENDIIKYFIYENKKYIKYDELVSRNWNVNVFETRDMEIDKQLAIILNEEQEKDNFMNSLTNVLFDFGGPQNKVRYKNMYSVKNCGDLALLVVKNSTSYNLEEVYCDERYYLTKKAYYENTENYGFFISKTHDNKNIFDRFYYIYLNETVSRPLSKNNFNILTVNEEKYNYKGNNTVIPRRLGWGYEGQELEYINIYGISHDGVYKKLFKHYIIENDNIYYIDSYKGADISVVALNNEEMVFLLSLLE